MEQGKEPDESPATTRRGAKIVARAHESGDMMPLEVMLLAMRQHLDGGDIKAAAAFAKEAAPYCHPRLNAIAALGAEAAAAAVLEHREREHKEAEDAFHAEFLAGLSEADRNL